MNTSLAPFDDVKVRQAVALAIDRSQIRDVAYLGHRRARSRSRCRPARRWYDDGGHLRRRAGRRAKAKALLAEAGYADGLTVEYLGLPQYPELLKTGQVLREQLKEIGIDMTIKPVEVSVWYDAFVSRTTRSPAPTRSARSTRTTSTRW